MDALLAASPLIVLILAMTVPARRLGLPLRAEVALPSAALLAVAVQVGAGSGSGGVWMPARVIEGVLASLTPLAVVFGAVVLFRTLRASGAMAVLTARLSRALPDPVMRTLLIAWSFSYLVEGLSGFGTPAALAAPILVGLGFGPVRAAAACLIMNTVPVVFGAVGMPVWYGLGELGLSDGALLGVGQRAAWLQLAIAPVVVALGLRVLFGWREMGRRWWRVLVVVGVSVGASSVTAAWSVEFPSIVGGLCGLAACWALGGGPDEAGATARGLNGGEAVVLSGDAPAAAGGGWRGVPGGGPGLPVWRAAAPLVLTVLLLAATRIEPLGVRGLLQADAPAARVTLGGLGELSASPALVVGLEGILGTSAGWQMQVLYVPFIIPFVLAAAACAPLLRMRPAAFGGVLAGAGRSLVRPAIALAGALVLVKVMMHGGDGAPVMIIGGALARAVSALNGDLWLGFAAGLGALGSFFSGSATVSNLTFGPVQAALAERLGLEPERVLAAQSVGAALGNMVCVHNIVAVAAVLGLGSKPKRRVSEASAGAAGREAERRGDGGDRGDSPVALILRQTALPLAVCLVIVGVLTLLI